MGKIRVELTREGARAPEHSGGSQHHNIGLDFFAAEDVIATQASYNESMGLTLFKAVVRTGVVLELPYGYHIQMASRSGLYFKQGIEAFRGVIDSAYRGEILIGLYQFADKSAVPFSIKAGDKVAQGLVHRSWDYELELVDSVNKDTVRGDRGFGSTDTAVA